MEDQGGGSGRDGDRSIDDFINQLRHFAEQATHFATGQLSARAPLPSLPPLPGALSAEQINAVARTIKAQRGQIKGMSEQLEAFDAQLAILEQLLDPLLKWSSTWKDLEESVTKLVRGRQADAP